MSGRNMHEDDPLDDFAGRDIMLEGVTKRVYGAGSGPAVIVMTEMPGSARRSRASRAGCAMPASRSTCRRCSAGTAPYRKSKKEAQSFSAPA
jgi:hypothetical protein